MARAPRTSRSAPPSGRVSRSEKSNTAQKRATSAEKKERADMVKRLAMFEKAAQAIERGDSWQNAITGLGIQGRDWTRDTTIETDDVLQRQQIDDLYAQDSLAAKIVDTLADDAIRNWFEIVGVGGAAEADFQKEIFSHFRRLRVKQRFLQWLRHGRKDGGGLLLIGADDGLALEQPLNPDRVREIRHLHFIERWMIQPDTIDIDPTSDTFGEPLYYVLLPRPIQSSMFATSEKRTQRKAPLTMSGTSFRVHRSRVIAYEGVQVSERRKQAFLGWGYSVLQRPFWSIQNYRVLWAHIATLFKHMAQTVIQFAGYAELSAGDFQQEIKKRLAMLQQARSTMSIIPLDVNDKFQEQTLNGLSGAIDVIRYAQEDLAQTADMPLTKLFGHMPAGFSKDDDAGRDNWHAKVHGAQEDFLLEPMMSFIELLVNAYNIKEPPNWSLSFLPLDVPDGVAAADIDLKEAQADDLRIRNRTVAPDEARNSLRADPQNRYPLVDGPAALDETIFPPSPTPEQQLAMKAKTAPAAGDRKQ